MKNCLFVGSFNPVTTAHFQIACDLLDQKKISKLYFLPVNSNKKNLASITDRCNMLNLIKKEHMEVINIYNYQEDGRFNYLVLEKIQKDFQIDSILMGSDLLLALKTFLEYENILKKYKLIIVERLEVKSEEIIKNYYKKYQDSFIIIPKRYLASSTKAREELKENKTNYLNKEVVDYIRKNNLYN